VSKQRPARSSREPGRKARGARHRDRHGRGLRGPLVPEGVPLARTGAERFDELVLDAVEHLDDRWGAQLADVEFAVEDVPPLPTRPAAEGSARAIPLARLLPTTARRAARIVVYRRPIEARAADRDELADLVHDVVVEQVAELLGLEPETVDPGYGGGAWDD
jgi:predicted Zn-dependent protease with MMP-like domain